MQMDDHLACGHSSSLPSSSWKTPFVQRTIHLQLETTYTHIQIPTPEDNNKIHCLIYALNYYVDGHVRTETD
ncbi:hypothetical protein RDWZM_006304 [Blomia tropicalis]|uniref:Uncharacterized protein n=1 Tax=Blomia tropicalis TaxID=40697 RepID=A0A9Q0M7L8_BLOTA|nr:hypothetical protein RDWZM_006304 [Blomia tropicalis]